jgi:hypothetical protein
MLRILKNTHFQKLQSISFKTETEIDIILLSKAMHLATILITEHWLCPWRHAKGSAFLTSSYATVLLASCHQPPTYKWIN